MGINNMITTWYKNNHIGFVILIILFLSTGKIHAQSIQADGSRQNNLLTSVPFLLITPQARSGAMGNAGVAVEADANAPSLNMA